MAAINHQALSEANAEVTEADLRAALNRIVRDSLAPVATGLGLHYIAFAVKHALTLSQPAASIMCLASGSAAAILLGFRLALRRWSVPERWVYPLVTMMAALLLFTNFLHLNLVSEPHQTANLIAVIMGAGFIALSARWLALMIMVIWIGWGATVWLSPPSSAWLYYAFALFAATVVAVIIHTIRVRALLRFETLRVQYQARTQALEAALAAKEISQLQLRESEARYRTLVENSPDAIYVHRDGKVLYANPASARLIGASHPQQLIGKSVIDFVAAEYRPLVAERMQRIMQEGITLSFIEVKGSRLDGAAIEVETMGLPIIYQGQPAAQVIVRDITERKRAEEALRESAQRFRSAFDHTPVGMTLTAPDGALLQVNRAFCEMLGYGEAELLSMNFQAITHPEDRQLSLDFIHRLLTGEIPFADFEKRYLHKHGHVVWARLSASIVRNAIGQPLYFVTQIQDITARKQMEEQLQRYATDLEKMVEARAQRIHELEKQQIENEKLAATGRMAARIAHEINNPLGAIQTAFRLISHAVPVEHRHHHYVGKIEKEIGRIAQIVRQMLDLHKPHQESPKAFRADEAIGEVIALMKPNIHERQLCCEQDLQRARETVTLPENMLRQILYNVMLNAAEASPANGLIRITAEIAAKRLYIAVSDRGIGIPQEIKARLFEPFFTTKNNGSAGGMGLGLSICKSLVEAMNGSIALESKPGEGTVCRIAIPLDKNDKNEKPATEL